MVDLKKNLMAVAFFLFFIPSLASAATFGKTTVGGSNDDLPQDYFFVQQASTNPASSTFVNSFSMYIRAGTAIGTNITFGLYEDNGGGSPVGESPVCISDEVTVSATSDWITADVASACSVVSGTQYYIGWWHDNATTLKFVYDASGGDTYYTTTAGYIAGDVPDPMPSLTGASSNYDQSIYVTYGVSPSSSSASSSAASSYSSVPPTVFTGSLIITHTACNDYILNGSGDAVGCNQWDTSIETESIAAFRVEIGAIVFGAVVLMLRWLVILYCLKVIWLWIFHVVTHYRPVQRLFSKFKR